MATPDDVVRKPLVNETEKSNHEKNKNAPEHRVTKIVRYIAHVLYFVTGQYAFPATSPNKSMAMTVYFFLISLSICCTLNIFPFVITVVEWILCSVKHYNMYGHTCYSIIIHPTIHNDTIGIPTIVLRELTNDSFGEDANNLLRSENDLNKFTIYTRLVLLLTSFSSMTSYLIFLFAFMKSYFFPHIKKVDLNIFVKFVNLFCFCADNDDDDAIPLHPFNDEDLSNIEIEVEDIDTNTSTRLTTSEAKSYFSMLIANIAIIIAMLAVFLYGQYGTGGIKAHDYYDNGTWANGSEALEILAISSYSFSVLCTLLSCFLFSKIAYGIQNKYKKDFCVYLKHVNQPREGLEKVIAYLEKIDEEKDIARHYEEQSASYIQLYYLQERDKHLTKVAKRTIRGFEFWFFFHWILYIVSSFLSLSLFLEVLIFYVNSSLPDQKNAQDGIHFDALEITFLGLFSASNCLFFLYPCIRAASVTNSRIAQICKLNKIYTEYQYITPELKNLFAEYLSSQNAGFELHILCARVPFGFSIAYISIFIALFSVLVKVGTSI